MDGPIATKPKLVCYTLAEGGYFVRGTCGTAEAREALIAWLIGWTDQDDYGRPLSAAEAAAIATHRHAFGGWYRFNPCHCGEGHKWDLGEGQPGQRGAFLGVDFTP